MTEYVVGIGSALWLGILTSISPCPLATNIAAISYIGRKVGNSRQVFLTGLLYTLGTYRRVSRTGVRPGSQRSLSSADLHVSAEVHAPGARTDLDHRRHVSAGPD